ncbi:conserved hypothetical protein [Alphaproteobacteria bacterium]
MSKKAKGSKNNLENRGGSARLRKFNSRVVVPIMYDGSRLKHGKYVAAKYSDTGELVLNSTGVPVPYSSIIS